MRTLQQKSHLWHEDCRAISKSPRWWRKCEWVHVLVLASHGQSTRPWGLGGVEWHVWATDFYHQTAQPQLQCDIKGNRSQTPCFGGLIYYRSILSQNAPGWSLFTTNNLLPSNSQRPLVRYKPWSFLGRIVMIFTQKGYHHNPGAGSLTMKSLQTTCSYQPAKEPRLKDSLALVSVTWSIQRPRDRIFFCCFYYHDQSPLKHHVKKHLPTTLSLAYWLMWWNSDRGIFLPIPFHDFERLVIQITQRR